MNKFKKYSNEEGDFYKSQFNSHFLYKDYEEVNRIIPNKSSFISTGFYDVDYSKLYHLQMMQSIALVRLKETLEFYDKVNPEKASDIAVFYTDFMIYNNQLNELDTFLYMLDINKLGEWSIVAILTSVFEARHYLTYWRGFYQASFRKLKDDNLNPEYSLSGFDR